MNKSDIEWLNLTIKTLHNPDNYDIYDETLVDIEIYIENLEKSDNLTPSELDKISRIRSYLEEYDYTDKSKGINMANKSTRSKQYTIDNLILFPLFGFGVLGALFGIVSPDSNLVAGFLVGSGIGVAMYVVIRVGIFGWERIEKWIEKEKDNGKLLPYILIGFVVAIAISGFLAVNLGQPSCDETGDPPYSNCVSYANDGFDATSTQKWDKFWGTLPVTVIIALLIAIIVRNGSQNNKNNN